MAQSQSVTGLLQYSGTGAKLCGPVADVQIQLGGTLNLSNSVIHPIENLSGIGTAPSGAINLGPNSILQVGPVSDSLYAGTIIGQGGLIKSNTSANSFSLTLGGVNTYDGTTLIQDGLDNDHK